MLHCCNVIIVLFCWSIVKSEAIIRNEDICGIQNGRRLYLELGEQGILYAKNVSFIKNAPRLQDSRIYSTNSSHDQCSLELVTCPSCVISLTFKSIGLSQNCGDGSFMLDSSCRCDYVWISEPPYEDVSGTPFCGFYSPISYRSNTRTLSITLLYSQSHNHAFTLEYTSERNRINLKGSDISSGIGKSRNSTIGGILVSPFFPSRYPRDLGMEYVITCPTEAPSCRVRVLFSDFQLAAVSIIEFYDWNGQRLDVSSGVRFRPPVIVSSGPSLLIRFYANGGTGLGYKAFYSFVLGHLYDKSVQPITDCGGYVENLGGAITMMDMVDEGIKIYDCVWLIRPPKTFLNMKTHVYLKIITFDDMAGSTELIIKQGPTSALLPLEILRHPASKLQPRRLKEHIAPISSGFHVSLRGTFGPTSHLAIAYTTFSYTDCFTGSDFLCQNHRCIPSHLNCDGFDHCGDNSDEPSTCVRDWELAPQDRKWHTNKANYYFPKIDNYPDLKTATFVFVASSLGLITLISALIVLLYRMGARARQQREFQSRLQTISELLDGARIEEVTVTDDPPGYESPPGYDEVVKLSLENENKKRKKKKSNSSCRLSRSCTSNYLNENESNGQGNVLADDGASTSESYHCNSTTESSVRQAAPESPPPPYITPPGTIGRRMNFLAIPGSSCAAEGLTTDGEQFLKSPGGDSRSLPLSEATSPELTTDAELLGAYLQICAQNQTESSTSQLSSWRDASTNISPEFEAGSKDVEVVRVVPEDKIKNRFRGNDNHERGPSTSSAPLEVETKKTAKPRSKRRDKNKVSNASSTTVSNTSTTISSPSSSTTVSTSPVLSVTAPSTAEETSPNTKLSPSNRTFINPSQISLNSPTQSLISSIKTSLNALPETSTLPSITPTNSVNSSMKISPITLAKPSSVNSVRGSTNCRVKTLNSSSNIPSTSSSEKVSPNPVGSTRGRAKHSQKCPTILSNAEEGLPKTLSTPVETHSTKLKCVLTSCAIASSSFQTTQAASFLDSSTAVTCSETASPITSSKTSISPSMKIGTPLGKGSSGSSVRESNSSVKTVLTPLVHSSSSLLVKGSPSLLVKGSPNSLVQGSPNTSVKDSPNLLVKSSLNSVKGSPNSLVKGSPNSLVKGSPSSLVKSSASSLVKGSANALAKGSASSLVKDSASSLVKDSASLLVKDSASLLVKNSANSLVKNSANSLVKGSVSPLVKDSSRLSGKASSSVKNSSSSSVKASSSPLIKSSTSPSIVSLDSPENTFSVALKASSTSAAKNVSSSPVNAPTSAGRTSVSPKMKASSSYSVSNEYSLPSVRESSPPTERSSLLPSVKSKKSVSSSSLIPDAESASFSKLSPLETNTKNDIVKLLGNSKIASKSPRRMNGNYSTASSSPASTIGKSFMRNGYSRKFSICSHDSFATKLTALSASSSYEKLHDDFEILSEYSSTCDSNSPNNTPFNTPKIKSGRLLSLALPNNQCTNCDLDSLYEGIRILDSFIARREKSVNYTRYPSRAAILFGTPSHISKRIGKNYSTIEKRRFWRSVDDTTILDVSRNSY